MPLFSAIEKYENPIFLNAILSKLKKLYSTIDISKSYEYVQIYQKCIVSKDTNFIVKWYALECLMDLLIQNFNDLDTTKIVLIYNSLLDILVLSKEVQILYNIILFISSFSSTNNFNIALNTIDIKKFNNLITCSKTNITQYCNYWNPVEFISKISNLLEITSDSRLYGLIIKTLIVYSDIPEFIDVNQLNSAMLVVLFQLSNNNGKKKLDEIKEKVYISEILHHLEVPHKFMNEGKEENSILNLLFICFLRILPYALSHENSCMFEASRVLLTNEIRKIVVKFSNKPLDKKNNEFLLKYLYLILNGYRTIMYNKPIIPFQLLSLTSILKDNIDILIEEYHILSAILVLFKDSSAAFIYNNEYKNETEHFFLSLLDFISYIFTHKNITNITLTQLGIDLLTEWYTKLPIALQKFSFSHIFKSFEFVNHSHYMNLLGYPLLLFFEEGNSRYLSNPYSSDTKLNSDLFPDNSYKLHISTPYQMISIIFGINGCLYVHERTSWNDLQIVLQLKNAYFKDPLNKRISIIDEDHLPLIIFTQLSSMDDSPSINFSYQTPLVTPQQPSIDNTIGSPTVDLLYENDLYMQIHRNISSDSNNSSIVDNEDDNIKSSSSVSPSLHKGRHNSNEFKKIGPSHCPIYYFQSFLPDQYAASPSIFHSTYNLSPVISSDKIRINYLKVKDFYCPTKLYETMDDVKIDPKRATQRTSSEFHSYYLQIMKIILDPCSNYK